MAKFLTLNIPSDEGNPQRLVIPSGIPEQLQGGWSTSGLSIVQLILNSLFLLVVFSALTFILYSGIRIIISRGDADALKNTQKQLLYSVIGLVIASLAFFLIRTLIVILGGNPEFFFKF